MLYDTSLLSDPDEDDLDYDPSKFADHKTARPAPVYNPLCHQGSFAEAERKWNAVHNANH